MYKAWQVQEAKQKISELLRSAAEDGPQVVSRHGEEVAVVVSAEAYRRLVDQRDFKTILSSSPDIGDLDIRRSLDHATPVDL